MIDKIKKIKDDILLWLSTEKGKKIKRAMPGALLLALMFAVVLITVFHSTDGFTTLVETEHAVIVTEKSSMTFNGYLLRNEQLVTSKYGGGALYTVGDAARVNPGDELVRVYQIETNEDVRLLTERIDRCISILEESLGDGKFTLGDRNIQDSISNLYYQMMGAIANGNTSSISANYDDFLILLNKMQTYKGNSEKLKSLLEEYKRERDKLENYYKGDFETVYAEKGGYFFKDTDGYEGIYTSSNIEELTYDSFFEMIGRDKNNSESVGKLVLDYRWYIVLSTVTGISDTFTIGEDYEMTFPDSGSRTFKLKLDRVIPDQTGAKVLMLFECGVVDSDFNYIREQQINVVNKNITGFKVPISAVSSHGGNSGVYVIKDGVATFRKIVILYEGDGYYIVSSENTNSDDYYVYLELNDRIITDCKNMYEGKVIE